ncbi:MAG TPA: hypothetical protein VGG44_03550 [Tepidisphaeraceae bacterium]|jgi:hypothetical protein
MQIPSIGSQLQPQFQTQAVKDGKPAAQSLKAQELAKTDADGDHDGDTSTSDKGQAVDTKA